MRNFLAVLSVLIVATLVSDARAGAYVGASFVQTDSEFKTAFDNFDADDTSYKIFGGIDFLKHFGLEASYRDLGSHDDTMGADSISVDIEAFDLCARGIIPFGKRFAVFGKAGYANISVDGNLDIGGSISDFDEDDWELMYGVGVDIKLLKFLGIRAEWETYDVEDDLNSFSAGAYFRF